MFKAAVGHGIDPDSIGAIQEALEQCQQTLDDRQPKAGILISATDFEYEAIIQEIRQTYPDILLVGGTSVGEMSSTMGFQQDSLTLMLFCSDEVTFRVGAGRGASKNERAASEEVIAQASSTEDGPEALKLCYALGDGLSVDGVSMVNELRAATHYTVPIVGGLTADDWRFEDTYQFISTPEKTEILQGAIVALTFAGNLKVSYGTASGQRPIGPKGIVTKSEGNTVHEIDGKPARDFYTKTLGINDVKLNGGGGWAGALAVYEADSADFYVRAPNGAGEAQGSISYFGNIAENSVVQIAETDNNNLLAAAKEAFQSALKTYPGDAPTASLIISCASRLKALGTQVNQEYALAAESLSEATPTMGFHAFGEISPFAEKTKAHFHNETFTAVLLGTH